MNKYAVPLIMAGNILFSWSFSQIRLPPGGGAPLSEAVLALCFLTFSTRAVLEEMGEVICLAPFILWWVFCIGWAALGISDYGLWALRDASQAIDSLYLIVGFNYARNDQDLNRLVKWAPWLVGLAAVNTLVGYTFRTEIAKFSPTITTEHGEATPIFGSFDLGVTVLIWAATYLVITAPENKSSLGRMAVAGGLVSYAIVMFQTRTGYLQLLSMLLLFLFVRRKAGLQLLSFLPMLLLVVAVLGLAGAKISGRLGNEISMDFFVGHLGAIFGSADRNSEAVTAAASGVDQRLQWWTLIYEKVTSDPWSFLTGLGYGFPLVPFTNSQGIQVREPHNSIISVFARSGLIGLFAFVWMHIELFVNSFRSYYAARVLTFSREWQDMVLWLIAFHILLLAGAGGEDVMEKPFHAVPYYFLWGVLLNLSYRLLPVSDPDSESPIDDSLGPCARNSA
ncbi:O-antigen ligase family protein [Methylocystis heyeri]|uniref:O-antigen ligase-related domain-containing protein n=1 Tax=Methylocystis heyeri TaxID=391905 RepID=A0A6B8KDF0_9HYPH|nr:O-antigen ligase family protein [Methylocystis heyeri]QGM44440.1 hypothetical protein H2LOC_001295 [Methylocystis heyeri]